MGTGKGREGEDTPRMKERKRTLPSLLPKNSWPMVQMGT